MSNTFTLHAIGLTLIIALMTIPICLVFGVALAWLVTRFSFPGRRILQTLIDIPFAVSPVVAGLIYLLLYGRNGWIGGWLDSHDIQLMFAWPGIFDGNRLRHLPIRGAGIDSAHAGARVTRGRSRRDVRCFWLDDVGGSHCPTSAGHYCTASS